MKSRAIPLPMKDQYSRAANLVISASSTGWNANPRTSDRRPTRPSSANAGEHHPQWPRTGTAGTRARARSQGIQHLRHSVNAARTSFKCNFHKIAFADGDRQLQ